MTTIEYGCWTVSDSENDTVTRVESANDSERPWLVLAAATVPAPSRCAERLRYMRTGR